MENKNSLATIAFGILLGLSILGSAYLVSNTFYKVKNLDNILTVTGSTRLKVTSDTIKWTANITKGVKMSELKNGYIQIASRHE